MDVTVLGCGAAYPRPGGACSGYLVRSAEATVWVDAGNGTMSNLQRLVSYREVDALVVSHVHADHTADVLPMMYALVFDDEFDGSLPVYAPPDVRTVLRSSLGAVSSEMFDAVLDFRPIDKTFEVGDQRFDPFRTVHPVETYGLRITEGEKVAVYTADTADFPELPDACRDADLLIAEATFVRSKTADPGIHLWAHETGGVAAKANARRLVLTHIWPSIGLDEAVAEASTTYDGPVEAAVELRDYAL